MILFNIKAPQDLKGLLSFIQDFYSNNDIKYPIICLYEINEEFSVDDILDNNFIIEELLNINELDILSTTIFEDFTVYWLDINSLETDLFSHLQEVFDERK